MDTLEDNSMDLYGWLRSHGISHDKAMAWMKVFKDKALIKKPMGRPFGYICHDDTTVCDGEKCDHSDHKGQVRRWVNID